MRIHRGLLILLLALIPPNQVFAANVDIAGTTYSIANGFTGLSHFDGSHFHSSNLTELPSGNPPIVLPGVAEVGGFFGDEEIRGVSEFALQGSASTATVFFDVLDMFALGLSPVPSGIDGLFGQRSYVGVIDMFGYAGNGMEEVSDYQIAPISGTPVLMIDVGPGLIVGGETLSVDVTDIYNNLVSQLASDPANAATALGVRLQMAPPADPNSGAITFGNFRLQVVAQDVPEPAAGLLLLLGMAVVLRQRRSA